MIIQQLAGVVGSMTPKSLILSPSSSDVNTTNTTPLVYAGITFLANGTEYATPAAGTIGYTAPRGTWVTRGDPGEVWIQWVRTGGTLGDWNSEDDGDLRLRLDVDRAWRLVSTGIGVHTIIGSFDFYTSSVGGDLLDTTGELTIEAWRELEE